MLAQQFGGSIARCIIVVAIDRLDVTNPVVCIQQVAPVQRHRPSLSSSVDASCSCRDGDGLAGVSEQTAIQQRGRRHRFGERSVRGIHQLRVGHPVGTLEKLDDAPHASDAGFDRRWARVDEVIFKGNGCHLSGLRPQTRHATAPA